MYLSYEIEAYSRPRSNKIQRLTELKPPPLPKVNDRSFSMTIELKMTMEWREPRISLNHGVFDQHFSDEELVLDSAIARQIWTPNFSIGHLIKFDRLETLNPADFLRVMPESNNNYSMYHQGTYVVKLKCPMEFNTFPFDRHVCFFEVGLDRALGLVNVRKCDRAWK